MIFGITPYEENVPLAPFSTFGIGGPARFFARCKTSEEVVEAIAFCRRHQLPFLSLGKGSNSLFDDRGFNGMVLFNQISYLHRNGGEFIAGSGYSFSFLGTKTASLGYAGLEFAAAIPASVGGAVCMNAGAGGKATADHLKEVEYINEKGEREKLRRASLTFGYRTSSFQERQGVIVEATFSLLPSTEAKVWQRKNIDYRIKTQPYKEKSAGCAFRNPGGNLSAGALIEECQLKGFQMGGAKVSDLHANFIVNMGNATSNDILHLLEYVRGKVWEKHKIHLENEIRVIAYE